MIDREICVLSVRPLVGLGTVALMLFLSMAQVACEDSVSIERIREMQEQGDWEGSLESLRALLDRSPDDPEASYRYGVALSRTGSPDRAIWALRKAARSEEWSRPASFELAAAAIASAEWENAIEVADALLEDDPEDLRALRIRGEARLAGKIDFEEALADYDLILELEPEDLEARASRAATLIALGRVDEAAQEIQEMERVASAENFSDQARSRICITRALFADEQNKKEEAETRFRECLESYPESWPVLEAFVEFLDDQRRFDEATDLLFSQLEKRPEFSSLRVILSQRLISLEQYEEAEAVLRAGLVLDDAKAVSDAWSGLADFYIALDDFTAASSAYEQSLAGLGEPTDFQRFMLADLMARANRNDDAVELAGSLDNALYRGLIEARVAMNRHEPAEALARLDEVLPSWPNNPGARYWAGRAAEQIGDFDRAIQEYRQSIRSSATFSDAGLRLARLHIAERANEDAWNALYRYVDEERSNEQAAALMMRVASEHGPAERVQVVVRLFRGTVSWPAVVAARAESVARRLGPESAIKVIEQSPGIDLARAGQAPVLDVYVRQQLALERYEAAAESVDRAIAAAPGSSEHLVIRGRIFAAQEQWKDAWSSHKRALELDDRNADAWLETGRLAAREGGLDDALRRFRRARDLSPDRIEAFAQAASLLKQAGRIEEAEEEWDALLREAPYDARAAIALVRSRLERADSGERTLELARRSLRFGGGEVSQRLIARVFLARGDSARASQILERLEEASADESPTVTAESAETGEATKPQDPR